MVNSNKILTVSYGTFSCTLEGFEDSFSTMKAIAEYFRDLASDDRYFGAEPPTPDTEMLARIAEREVERRVEARMEKGSVVLRTSSIAAPQEDGPAPEQAVSKDVPELPVAAAASVPLQSEDDTVPEQADLLPASDTTEDDIPADVIPRDTQRMSEEPAVDLSAIASEIDADSDDPDAETSVLQDIAAPAALAAAATAAGALTAGDIAEKLQRIRAVVSKEDNEDGATEFIEDEHADSVDTEEEDASIAAFLAEHEEEAGEDFDVEDLMSQVVSVEPAQDEIAHAQEAVTDLADAEDDLLPDGIATNDDLTDQPQAETDPTPANELADDARASDKDAGTEDTVDAEPARPALPRVRARVTRVKRAVFNEAVAAGQLEEVDDAEDTPPAPLSELSSLDEESEADLARELAALEAEIASLKTENEAGSDLLADEDDDDDDDTLDDVVLYDAGDDDEDDIAAEEDQPENILAEAADDKPEDDDLNLAAFLAENEAAEDDDEDTLFAEDDAETVQDSDPYAESDDDLIGWDDEDEAAATEDAQPASAAPVAEEDWDEYDEDDAEEDRKWAEAEARIKAEEEARLKEEEAEAAIDRVARESVRKTVRMSSPARAMLTENRVEEDANSVSRLLNQTETELDEPDARGRRSAIAHLRAAVAATRADRILGRKKDPEEEHQPYREDLADVVRPRRPQSSGGRTERPTERAEAKPAPLTLVAEQRVDEKPAPAPKPVRPVRPRRPGVAETAAAATPRRMPAKSEEAADSGFAEFAENVGATELSDLLEAAASYMSFVEGIDQFSRPQLMSKVLQVEESESSREDRLRSFGQLLRDGKIQKTRGGRFTASDSIGFNPGNRAVG